MIEVPLYVPAVGPVDCRVDGLFRFRPAVDGAYQSSAVKPQLQPSASGFSFRHQIQASASTLSFRPPLQASALDLRRRPQIHAPDSGLSFRPQVHSAGSCFRFKAPHLKAPVFGHVIHRNPPMPLRYCHWGYLIFNEQSTSATPVDCPWTQRLDGHLP